MQNTYAVRITDQLGAVIMESFETYLDALRFAHVVAERRMGHVQILERKA